MIKMQKTNKLLITEAVQDYICKVRKWWQFHYIAQKYE